MEAKPSQSLIYSLEDRPKHAAFLFSRAPVVSMFGGYASAKTVFGCIKLHMQMEYFAHNRGIVGRKTFPALERSTQKTFLEVAAQRNGGTLDAGPVIKKFVSSPSPILHYQNGSTVEFVTLESAQKIRGAEVGCILIDQGEEIAEEIYLELIGRSRYWNKARAQAYQNSDHAKMLYRQLGYIPKPFNQVIVVGNPAPNWVMREFGPDHPPKNECYQVTTMENEKYLDPEYIPNLLTRYPKDWVDRYVHGSWSAFGGQIYKAFEPQGVHIVERFEIPKHWPRFIGWDHGYKNPTAIIGAAVDEQGNIVVFQEHYLADAAPEVHAKTAWQMAENNGWPKSDAGKLLVHMDYAVKGNYGGDGKSIWDHYVDLGIYGIDAQKDVHAGILLVSKYLQPNPDREFPKWHPRAGEKGSPTLFIGRAAAPNLVNELQTYQWEEAKPGKNEPEAPVKKDDHACDSLRYLCMAANKAHAPALPGEKTAMELAIEAENRIAASAFIQSSPFAYEDSED